MSLNEGTPEASKGPPPRQHTTEVLHQRRGLPRSPAAMAVFGFLIVATLGYLTLYSKSKHGTTPSEAGKVAVNTNGGMEAASRHSK